MMLLRFVKEGALSALGYSIFWVVGDFTDILSLTSLAVGVTYSLSAAYTLEAITGNRSIRSLR